jgi:hypothetical protein
MQEVSSTPRRAPGSIPLNPVSPDSPPTGINHRFTLDGSDELESHLADTCNKVQAEIQLLRLNSRLEALALGGGYGRGEGGVLRSPTGDRPYNDLEFYVFCRGNRIWNERSYRDPLRNLGEKLSPDAGLHVEFKVDSLNRLRKSPITMFSYDLVSRHRVLWPRPAELNGRNIFVSCEHHLTGGRISLHEATRLLLNRCTGLLLAKELLLKPKLTAEDSDFIGRNLSKARLALGDAVLTVFGQYHWSCIERHERLNRLPEINDLPILAEVRRQHRTGVEFKLHPFQTQAPQQELRDEHQEISDLAQKIWLWLESRRLNRPLNSVREYCLTAGGKRCGASILRNVLLNAKTFGPAGIFHRMAAVYPRERLLNSLPLLLWGEPLNDLRIRRHLQNQLRTAAQDWQSLVAAYMSIWPHFG